jgi:hypothetical protein
MLQALPTRKTEGPDMFTTEPGQWKEKMIDEI